MAQVVGIVAAQIALDQADKMLQNQGQNQSSSSSSSSTDDDDDSFSMSSPSGAIFSSDPTQLVSSMLPDDLNSVLQLDGRGGGSQNQKGSIIDEGEDILDQSVSSGMSFVGKFTQF